MGVKVAEKMPAWAERIVHDVCRNAKMPIPAVEWKHREGIHSSGLCYPANFRNMAGRIIIRCGWDDNDAKLVLLHELAHHLTPTHNHSHQFWKVAMRLYKKYRLNPEYVLSRESGYRKASVKAFEQVFRSQKHLAAAHKAPMFEYVEAGSVDDGPILLTVSLNGEVLGTVKRYERASSRYSYKTREYEPVMEIRWMVEDEGRQRWFRSRKAAAQHLQDN
jgi:hypothetical protein